MSIRLVDGSYAAPYQTRWGEGWVYVRDGELAGVDLPGEAGGPCKLSADCPEVGAGDEPGGADGGRSCALPSRAPRAASPRARANWSGWTESNRRYLFGREEFCH